LYQEKKYWPAEDLEFANNYVRNGIYTMPDIHAEPIYYAPTKDFSAKAKIDFAFHSKPKKPRAARNSKAIAQTCAADWKKEVDRLIEIERQKKHSIFVSMMRSNLAFSPINSQNRDNRIYAMKSSRATRCIEIALKSEQLPHIEFAIRIAILFRWSYFSDQLFNRYALIKGKT
jgi:hypothetical protein